MPKINLFYRLPCHIAQCFSFKNLIWHIVAFILTYIIVQTGFDWWYFTSTRNEVLTKVLLPAILIGAFVPVFLPLSLIVFGLVRKNRFLTFIGSMLGQAAIAGSLVSSFYKIFTGRIEPNLFNTTLDISREFQFGFLEYGVFWGWPSSHTVIAFAMSVSLIFVLSKKHFLIPILLYSLYIGIGISTTIHWFSDFAAGAIIGSVIGMVLGKGFKDKLKEDSNIKLWNLS